MWYSPQQLRAAFFMRPIPEHLTQAQRVRRQYKAVLVCLKDHAGHQRPYWYTDVGRARARYEEHRHVTDTTAIEVLLAEGDSWLKEHRHWAPYKRSLSWPSSYLFDLIVIKSPTLRMVLNGNATWRSQKSSLTIIGWSTWKRSCVESLTRSNTTP